MDRLTGGQQMHGAKDNGLYTSAEDLYAMRYSVSQQTQWSAADAVARRHVDLPGDSAGDLVGNAVDEGWDAGSEYLRNVKERP
ncbi:hypothetical protein AB0F36_23870 [Streptomyces sp. NPDC029080]|uniref:hypothetical protein n=1 Tax=Streptomyces sp. NPDC029080 TaxID=3155017 RepID=UPI003403F3DE